MKKVMLVILFFMAMLPAAMQASDVAVYDVVPLPRSIHMLRGEPFILSSNTRIVYGAGNEAVCRNAKFLSDYIRESTGINTTVASLQRHSREANIRLILDAKVDGDEAYVLTIGSKGVSIAASTPKGMFYGVQTLRKSLPTGSYERVELPAARIDDAPRFSYRGMMLDCSRHFFSVDFIKKYIDLMAMHGMNTFHWHLTDDQGWRIEIKKYPRLTSVGSKRSRTIVGHNSMVDDATEYGGYYTQEEARQIVEYAHQRHVRVIPEVDMPGHMKAALAAYPELGCTGGPYEVGHRWGVYLDVLCLGNEKVMDFCEDVINELCGIFPDRYIHIGGDETPTERWQECPRCLALAMRQGLTPKMLQGYFTNRIEQYVNLHGRNIIGWDEILQGDINQSATIMSWRGTENGERAASLGHDVVMSPTDYCYFDYCQTDTARQYEPSPCEGYVSVEKVYGYEPCPKDMTPEARRHILGVQANVWTEYLACPGAVEYHSLPRMAALCEVQWSDGKTKFEDFKERLTRLTSLYRLNGYTYAHHLWPSEMVSPWEDN